MFSVSFTNSFRNSDQLSQTPYRANHNICFLEPSRVEIIFLDTLSISFVGHDLEVYRGARYLPHARGKYVMLAHPSGWAMRRTIAPHASYSTQLMYIEPNRSDVYTV